MIVSIGIFIALAIAVILYQKKKLPEWCMRKNSRNYLDSYLCFLLEW